ncbi:aminodeoxychorismate lyase [Corynebacterium sp. ES2715-CONJ3]|uniref:aminodeoxychorismate lyase n=1 Tax=Corynebacterium sp. ES2715-CONJ3 TaxID=2974028 RepID=UPI002169BAF3|nr:aminodeoxychorismate lyase [Corynebacterium sp. ES2715-CONJ3]MCS4491886.1 aminodeoxychorismate lyase [Corynebacterium sp. ES2715-CONJ3]
MATIPAPLMLAIEPFGGSIRNHNINLPFIYADDAAVTRGDGIFETVLLRKGKPRNFDRHFSRFTRSAELLDLPHPIEKDWRRATEEAAELWGTEVEGTITWTLSRGRASTGIPSAWLTVNPVSEQVIMQREQGVAVLTTPRGFVITNPENAPWLAGGAKTLSYAATMAALRWARAYGYDDVLYTDGDIVLEGATSNLITVRGNKIRTPSSNPNVLPGTTQQALFEYATEKGWRCGEREITLDDLYKADSVWLISSVRRGARIRSLNGDELAAPDNEAEVRKLIEKATRR